jgi:hypothetical protein
MVSSCGLESAFLKKQTKLLLSRRGGKCPSEPVAKALATREVQTSGGTNQTII